MINPEILLKDLFAPQKCVHFILRLISVLYNLQDEIKRFSCLCVYV